MSLKTIRTFLTAGLFLTAYCCHAQTYFWTEDFTTPGCTKGCKLPYTTTNGTWTWVSTGTNGAGANTWYVSNQEEGLGRTKCGASGPDPSLHVGNVSGSPCSLLCPGGDCGAAYDACSGTPSVVANARATSPVISCTGRSNITLSFNYIMNGEASHDYATVWYNTGSGWTLLASPPQTATCIGGQGKWTYYSVLMPASANNNASVQIGFNWTNDANNSGNDPSFAVDSIRLSVPTVLPVELLSFKADYDDNSDLVDIDWSTATETNNAFFTIERSTDGETFSEIAMVKGAGNSMETMYYTANDPNILGGIVYYRLKQTDYDGHYVYSQVVSVNEKASGHIRLYPDPVTSEVNIVYYATDVGEMNTLEVYDCVGRLACRKNIISSAKGENKYTLDVSLLAKGAYILKLNTMGKIFVNKFIRQ